MGYGLGAYGLLIPPIIEPATAGAGDGPKGEGVLDGVDCAPPAIAPPTPERLTPPEVPYPLLGFVVPLSI